MGDTLKEFGQRVLKARAALEEHTARQATLEARHSALQASIPELEAAVKKAEGVKVRALDAFVVDALDEVSLTRARAEEEQVKRRLLETIELIDATGRAKERGREELPKIQTELGNRERDLAGFKRDEIVEKIRGNGVGDLVRRAWVLQLDAGGGYWDGFLRGIFPNPSTGEIEELRQEMSAPTK